MQHRGSSETRPRGRWFFWGVVVVAAVLAGYYVFGFAMILKYGSLERRIGWESKGDDHSWIVVRVDPDGPAGGVLEVGDRVLAVDGDTRVQVFGPRLKLRREPPDGPYRVLVLRADAEVELTLEVEVTRDPSRLVGIAPLFVSSLAFWAISAIVGLQRSGDSIPRKLAAAGFAVAGVLLLMSMGPGRGLFTRGEFLIAWVLALIPPFHLLLGYRFFYWFTSPEPAGTTAAPGGARQSDLETPLLVAAGGEVTVDAAGSAAATPAGGPRRGWWAVGVVLWTWGVVLYLVSTPSFIVLTLGPPGALDFVARNYGFFGPYWRYADLNGSLLGIAALVAMLGVLVSNYRHICNPDQRRRLTWVVYGTTFGLLPPAVVWMILGGLSAVGIDPYARPAGRLIYFLSTAAPILIPLTLGHAVARHRILGVDVIVRRGLQYLLARNVLRGFLLLPVVGLVYTVVSNPDRTVAELVVSGPSSFYLVILVTGAFSLRYRSRLGLWLDRRFFRERYDHEKILLQLIERLKEGEPPDQIVDLIRAEIGAALHPRSVLVVYRDPSRSGYVSRSGGGAGGTTVPEHFELVRLAERHPSPIDIGPEQPLRQSELPEHERTWLDALGVELIVPMQGPTLRLAGLMLLGPKKSEEPYSPGDRRLLTVIAGQVAVMLENRWLSERVDREAKVRREVFAHLDQERVNLVKECPACGTCFDRVETRCPDDGSELELTLPVERLIDERYHLVRVLGRGGMGAVYEATDQRLSRRVAVKIMMGHLFGQQTALHRFEREARASANLDHRNIIAIHDYGRIGSDGAYLVMELVQGVTLRTELRRRGRIEPAVAAELFDPLLDALAWAHAAGVIHRDLKPENVMIARPSADEIAVEDSVETGAYSTIKVLDFGLAKVRMEGVGASASLTAAGTVLGTWAYMSPEQLAGEEVDERSDLFSIGVMVVEAITGHRPFEADTPASVLQQRHQEVSLESDEASVRKLEIVLRRSLARDRDERFASATEMRHALIPALGDCPVLG